jgi:hypothetical protein
MLTVRIEPIKTHPKKDTSHVDLLDPQTPNGRGLSFRFQASLNGLMALREACDLAIRRAEIGDRGIVELLESAGEGPYLKRGGLGA